MEDLSVSAFLSKIWDIISGFFAPLQWFGWSFGDWTLFMPFLLWFVYWVISRIRKTPAQQRIGGIIFLIGILVGGIFEHYQESLEECLPGGPRACIEGKG